MAWCYYFNHIDACICRKGHNKSSHKHWRHRATTSTAIYWINIQICFQHRNIITHIDTGSKVKRCISFYGLDVTGTVRVSIPACRGAISTRLYCVSLSLKCDRVRHSKLF